MNRADLERLGELTVDALREIQRLTKIGGDKAATVLATIDAIVTSLLGAQTGKVTLAEVEEQLKRSVDSVAAGDATAAAEADDYFDKKSNPK